MSRASDELLQALPSSIRKRIERLSKTTKETPVQIVEAGVTLYEQRLSSGSDNLKGWESLEQVTADPEKQAILTRIMKLLGKKAASTMTDEQRQARALAGANAKLSKMSPEARKEHALLMVNARRAKKLQSRPINDD